MRNNPWQEVLDTLYEMGGRGEHPSEDTDKPLQPEVNLVEQTDYSNEEIIQASNTLQSMDLATNSTPGNYTNSC